jgi:group I intron endonuclease
VTGYNIQVLNSIPLAVVVYANADTQKESILNENKGKAGIYCWVHNESGKIYVGSSIDLHRRFMQYYNIKYITRASKSSVICKALLKYGYSAFQLNILEFCDPSLVIMREQYYIDLIKPEYNILKIAGSLFGFKHNSETIKKMSDIAKNRSEETIIKLREAALGKTYTHKEETKIKLREIMLGKKHSENSKVKMKEFQLKRKVQPVKGLAVKVKDTKTNEIYFYSSLREAGKLLNSNHASMRNYLNTGKLYRDQYLISSYNSEIK